MKKINKVWLLLFISIFLVFVANCKLEQNDYINELECKVSFVNTDVLPKTIKKGEKIEYFEPKKVDHQFEGWFIDEEFMIPFNQFSAPINASIKLYAKWTYIPPKVIEPKVVSISSFDELVKISEISELLNNKENNVLSFDYYQIKASISEIIDEEKGIFKIALSNNNILVKGIKEDFKALNLKLGDFITLTSVMTYDEGLCMMNASVNNIERISHYVSLWVNNEIIKYDLDEYNTIYSIPKPNLEDFEFRGWYYDERYEKIVEENAVFDSDITLYAKLEEIKYFYITYIVEENKNVVKYKDPVYLELIDDPVKSEEYRFVGWYKDEDFKTLVDESIEISENITLYAKFEPLFFYVTLHVDGVSTSIKCFNQIDVASLEIPSKLDHTFDGWFRDENFLHKVNQADSLYETTDLYAKFTKIPYYYVSIYYNDELQMVHKWLNEVALYTLDEPTKKGYEFLGWFFDATFEEEIPKDFVFKTDITIYAYLKEIKYYNVNIYIDDFLTPFKTYALLENTTLRSNNILNPVKENYRFDGWYCDQAFSEPFSVDEKVTSDLSLYAKFTYVQVNYTVTMVILGSNSIQEVPEGTKINQIDIPLIENYKFMGWYKDASYNEKYHEHDLIAQDTTLYGYFYELMQVNIYTSVLDEKKPLGKYLEDHFLIDILPAISLDDYIFDGWYLDSAYTLKVDKTFTIKQEDITVYAKMIKINYYNIKTVVLERVEDYPKVKEGVALSSIIKNPTLKDYIFEGWYTSLDYQTEVNLSTTVSQDLVLYAKMTKINYYTVTTYIDNQVKTYGEIKEGTLLKGVIPTPLKDDYYFLGWFDSSDYSNEIDLNSPIQSNMVLYAKFEKIPYYDVNIYVDGVVQTTSNVKDQTYVSNLLKPTKEEDYFGKYTFQGFYLDENFETIISPSTKITSNLNLYAKFSVKRYYHVKYIVNLDEFSITLEEPNNKIVNILKPTSFSSNDYKYTFKCWALDMDGVNKLTDDFTFTETDTSIYAIFDKIPYYTVTIKYLDQETNQLVLAGEKISNIITPSVEGYVFSGFFFDSKYSISVDPNTIITSNTLIYAKLRKYINIMVIYNNESTTHKVLEGDSLKTIPTPSVSDMRFVDWYLDPEFTVSSKLDENYLFTSNLTIYAEMVKIKHYTVFMCLNSTTQYGLTNFTEYDVKENTLVSEFLQTISTPQVPGYDFDTYFDSEDFTNVINQNALINEDIYIYAHFTPRNDIPYKIKYWLETPDGYENYRTLNLTGTTESEITPEVLDIENYMCPSSIPHGKIKGDGTTSIELYYTRCAYTIKYYVKKEVVLESDPIKWGDKVTFISNANFEELVGDAFISGWYQNEEFTEKINYEVMIVGGINVYGDVELIYEGTKGLIYSLNEEETAYIVSDYEGTDEFVTIANGFHGLPVEEIGEGCFYNNEIVKKLDMSNHITKVDNRAFFKCSNLEEINLSDSITYIGSQVFYDNFKLKNLLLPSFLEEMGRDNFRNLSSLERVEISCDNHYVKTIDNVLFDFSMTKLLLYPALKEDIVYPIPSSVKEITSHAFSNCLYLETLNTNVGLLKIASYAISDCENLKTIKLSSTIFSLEQSFINHLPKLETIQVDVNNTIYSHQDGVLFNKDKTILISYPSNKQNKNYEIPKEVRSISSYAFSYNNNLESIFINSNIKRIAYFGFYNCLNLTITLDFSSLPSRYHPKWCELVKEIKFK